MKSLVIHQDEQDYKELDNFGQEIVKPREAHQQLGYFIKNPQTIKVLERKGIKYFFPIQYMTFEALYKRQDLIGRDRTGSGKTMAYTLPILERFRETHLFHQHKKPKFVVVLPTRELCMQVVNEINSLKLNPKEYVAISIYGGCSKRDQIEALRSGVDFVVATPGRLIDLMDMNKIDLSYVQAVCLDQADEMLKMGFQQDVEKIYKFIRHNMQPQYYPQNLLFSATVPKWVQQISRKYMKNDKAYVDLIKDQQVKTSKTVTHCSMCIKYHEIIPIMRNIVEVYCGRHGRCIIFCEKKNEVKEIISRGEINIESEALHGDVPQDDRQKTFKKFKEGKLKCLISTNVAARGLDIPNVDLVIQLQPPAKVDDYIHRSGRTGRAGKKGMCLTIYLKSEQYLLRNIEMVASIKFKDIGPPQPDDVLTRNTMDVVHNLKRINQNCLDYFKDIAQKFSYEQGDLALARALAMLTKTNGRLKQYSVMGPKGGVQGYITYKFKIKENAESTVVQEKDLILFLKKKLQQPDDSPLINVVRGSTKSISKSCIAFNFPELYMKKMQEIQHELEQPKNQDIYTIHRVSALSQLQIELKRSESQLPRYTQQEYDDAMYYKHELFIGRLMPGDDVEQLQGLFHRKGIRFVSLSMKEKAGRAFAFMVCLTKQDLENAVKLDGMMFAGRNIELRAAEGGKGR